MITPSVWVTGVRRTISSHSGVSRRPSKVTPAEPRSRTLPLPATASPASRGRPRGNAGSIRGSRARRGGSTRSSSRTGQARIRRSPGRRSGLHPYLRGREPAEKAEEHGERLSPAQPRFFSEEDHSVEHDQGVTEGEKRDVARHIRPREDVLSSDEHEVEPHHRPYAKDFGIWLAQLEPMPETQPPDQFLDPAEEDPPGVHERPQVPDERGKEAEAHPSRHPHEGGDEAVGRRRTGIYQYEAERGRCG